MQTRLRLLCAALAASLVLCAGAASAQSKRDDAQRAKAAQAQAAETQQYCANIAAAAEAVLIAQQKKQLAELEQQVQRRVQELETKRGELQEVVDKYEAFFHRTDETLISVYTRMKPDAAAAQIAKLDEEVAASLIVQLKPKNSSAIMGEMEPTHAALLSKKIAALAATKRNGKKL
jgi:flagellar motility protein MotE (MotC chaperone)